MEDKKLFNLVEEHMESVILQEAPMGLSLWQSLLTAHPADIAEFLGIIQYNDAQRLFTNFHPELRQAVFEELSEAMQKFALSFMNDQERVEILHKMPLDKITDLFEVLSDDELKTYLSLLHKRARDQVLSLLKFDSQSAGGIMDTEVMTLREDSTVEKSIRLLQRLRPSRDVHQQIFITDNEHKLLGHINLEDLVLERPDARIASFMHKNELIAIATEDQEDITKKMVHYGLMIVPVVDMENHFLGVISSDTLADVLMEEATEDVQKMAAMPPLKYPYFEMPFGRLIYQRCYVLVALFLAESFAGPILRAYDGVLTAILISFIPLITSAGGNTGSQTSAIIIQGLASGEFDNNNMTRLLRRELCMSSVIALFLGVLSFARVYFVGGSIVECSAVSGALSIIVFVSAMLGSTFPFILRQFNIDPAFSAGPFLATVMDILGIFIFCYLSKLLIIG
jgi:magnesium transporter